MEIKVLGPGCARCFELERRTRTALSALGSEAAVEKVSDIKKIMEWGILATPGLVVAGKVKCSGRIPSLDEIKQWILEES